MGQQPQSVSDVFPPKWFKAWLIPDSALNVTIAGVTFEEFFIPTTGQKRASAVVSFKGETLRLILNKTQAKAIADIVGSELFRDWAGKVIALVPDTAPNKKPTIRIEAARKQAVNPATGEIHQPGGNGQHEAQPPIAQLQQALKDARDKEKQLAGVLGEPPVAIRITTGSTAQEYQTAIAATVEHVAAMTAAIAETERQQAAA